MKMISEKNNWMKITVISIIGLLMYNTETGFVKEGLGSNSVDEHHGYVHQDSQMIINMTISPGQESQTNDHQHHAHDHQHADHKPQQQAVRRTDV